MQMRERNEEAMLLSLRGRASRDSLAARPLDRSSHASHTLGHETHSTLGKDRDCSQRRIISSRCSALIV